ncbi:MULTISPECIES: M23 family metallopeptidase [Cyanophyceae]|uniref:M23 family metallopeptidase n=1 Tax=Cyanophyceae TaxID=3028117 RepID=UPI00168558FC|nr:MULTISPECIES: M23 family metallopeptidase [Cyanophyceae]MBD1918427.1 M23 family metallopeptidase [Phormidium sp. FACHB-77]MBD2028704.1 M23 family metallopeptidase [Phormidium sp. FACHB-322]MBD2051125.1 M23 family metallopeptidase [Leptolyngbya sp. FACHB-60]
MEPNRDTPLLTRRSLLVATAAGSIAVLLSHPAQAYDVVLNPTAPELGDTISVIVIPRDPAATTPPKVTVNDSLEYPTFPISGNRFRALVPTSPLNPPGRMVIRVIGTEETRNLAVGLKNRNFPTQRITLSPSQSDLGTQHEFDRVAAFKNIVSPERYWNGPLVRPNEGRTSTQYGVRRYYNGVFAQDYYHRGLDYASPTGSPVMAPAAGRIALVGRVSDGFELHGNTVGIDHGQGVLSIMIHLSRIDVNEGAMVQPGQVVGAVGSTGASTGPHLHWGLYVHGVCVDPTPWRDRGFE